MAGSDEHSCDTTADTGSPSDNLSSDTSYPYPTVSPILDAFALDEDNESVQSDLSELHFDSLDDAIDCYSLGKFIRSQNNRNKRQRVDDVPTDTRPMAFVRFNSRVGKAKPITLRALLDIGGGGTLVAEEFAKKLKI